MKTVLEDGVLSGCHVVDVKVDFYDGKQHPVDSKDIAFQTAGKHAFREAFLGARPGLLEPICKVQVKMPEEHMGDVMGDISGRRGKVMGRPTSILQWAFEEAGVFTTRPSVSRLQNGQLPYTNPGVEA